MGLGRRFALDLAAEGATVVGVARGAEALAALELAGGGFTRSLDVSDETAVWNLVEEIVERAGRLDILINNAGIEERAPVGDLTPAAVRRTMDVNLYGVVNCTLAALPHMRAHGEGWIVNVSSGVARSPLPRQAAYSASKAAIVAFSEAISYELEPSIKVKVLSPGFVATTRMAQGSVEHGFKVPPKMVHRTEEQVSRALLRGLDGKSFEINCARAETLVARALVPSFFRRNVLKAAGR